MQICGLQLVIGVSSKKLISLRLTRMEILSTVIAASLFIIAVLYTNVSGRAFNDGSQKTLKADTMQLAEPTNDPCVYKGRYLTVDLRSIAAQFK